MQEKNALDFPSLYHSVPGTRHLSFALLPPFLASLTGPHFGPCLLASMSLSEPRRALGGHQVNSWVSTKMASIAFQWFLVV